MIVVGGRDKLVDAGCNTLFEVIDLNTFTVTDSLRDDGEYHVPSEVVSTIGGGSVISFPRHCRIGINIYIIDQQEVRLC